MEKLFFGETSSAYDWKKCEPQVIESAEVKRYFRKNENSA
jgi:hypothetical protein